MTPPMTNTMMEINPYQEETHMHFDASLFSELIYDYWMENCQADAMHLPFIFWLDQNYATQIAGQRLDVWFKDEANLKLAMRAAFEAAMRETTPYPFPRGYTYKQAWGNAKGFTRAASTIIEPPYDPWKETIIIDNDDEQEPPTKKQKTGVPISINLDSADEDEESTSSNLEK